MRNACGEGGADEGKGDDGKTERGGWTSEFGPLLEGGEHERRSEVHDTLAKLVGRSEWFREDWRKWKCLLLRMCRWSLCQKVRRRRVCGWCSILERHRRRRGILSDGIRHGPKR